MASKEAQELFDQSTDLYIMVVGKPGIGKSTIINGIIGKTVAEVSEPMVVQTEGVTKHIEEHELDVNNGHIFVYDTPGLFDLTIKEDIFAEIKERSKNVDIYFVCIDMTVTRSYEESKTYGEIKMLREIRQILGEDIWKKSVFLFTKANLVVSAISLRYKTKKDLKAGYDKCFTSWKDIVNKEIKSDDITFAAAGHSDMPKILEDDDSPWLSTLWEIVLNKIDSVEGKATLVKVNFNRLTHQEITEEEVQGIKLEHQLIQASSGGMGGLLGSLLGGGVAGAAGAAGVAGFGAASSIGTATAATAGAAAALTNPIGWAILGALALGGGAAGYFKFKK